GGMGAASVADARADKARIVAIVPAAATRAVTAADDRLRTGFRRDEEQPPALVTLAPDGRGEAQARAAFDAKGYEASAVLYGPLDAPRI
ncbi:hypothetical protein, partial [Clostridium perfringens]